MMSPSFLNAGIAFPKISSILYEDIELDERSQVYMYVHGMPFGNLVD